MLLVYFTGLTRTVYFRHSSRLLGFMNLLRAATPLRSRSQLLVANRLESMSFATLSMTRSFFPFAITVYGRVIPVATFHLTAPFQLNDYV